MRSTQWYRSGLVILIVLFGGWVWHTRVIQNPNRVFSDMLRNNLSTTGVTRLVSQQGSGLSASQYTQLSLGARPQAHALTVFKQNGGTLSTEEISTATSDYVRYQTIKTPAKLSAAKLAGVLGKWAQLPAGTQTANSLTSGLFDQALNTTLPIANLTADDRTAVLRDIQQSGVFSYDTAAVKTVQLNGRKTYEYAVSIKPSAYVSVMQRFEKYIGLTTYAAIDPATYAKSSPLAVDVYVDARSHQLSETYQVANQRREQYQGFGITDTTPLPKATITTTELTKRLAALNQ